MFILIFIERWFNMVDSISGAQVPIAQQQKKESNGPGILGTVVSAGAGAGAGYVGYKYFTQAGKDETIAKLNLNTSEDSFIKSAEDSVKRSMTNCSQEEINEVIENNKAGWKEIIADMKSDAQKTLEECKGSKIKYVAGGAALITAAYLGIKMLFGGGDKSEKAE